jgi:hypothetical protein
MSIFMKISPDVQAVSAINAEYDPHGGGGGGGEQGAYSKGVKLKQVLSRACSLLN